MIAGRAVCLAGLLLVAFGLSAVVYAELTQDEANHSAGEAVEQDGSAPSGRAVPSAKRVGFAPPPLAAFAAVTERPLFSATRHPPPVEASQEAIRQSGTMLLEGVVLSKAERLALVSHGRPPAVSRVPEGQEVDGWTVVEIHPDGIVLQRGATRQELKLLDKHTRPPKPPAPKQ